MDVIFTQSGDTLSANATALGNAYSDITVQVKLTDETFTGYNHLDLYVCNPRTREVYRSNVVNETALIDHTAVCHAGDICISLAGYGNSQGQKTTNTVLMVLNQTANPEEAYDPDADWKLQVSDKLIQDAVAAEVAAYLEEHGISSGGSSSGNADVSFAAVSDVLATGKAYARIGSIGICFGTFQLSDFAISTVEGNNYRGNAILAGKNAEFAITGGFPFCFTSAPRVRAWPTGISSVVWPGMTRGDAAGLTHATFFRGDSSTLSQFSCGYIAIGRIDGERKGGAAVITEALAYLGETPSTEIIDAYNEIRPDNTQDYGTGWCSEFASVCASRAGISTDIFPYTASAYKGAKAFADIGCCYIRQSTSSTVFYKATVTAASSSSFTYTLDTSETYTPQLGDVIWTTDDDFLAPKHTGLVVSLRTDDDTGYISIYTIEGNMSNDDSTAEDDSDSSDGRTVKRMCRVLGDSTTARNKHIFGIGRVNYPSDYEYGGSSASGGETETTAYTVASNLTNCSISNSASSVTKGNSYTATVTANSGYTLSSVICTMGGVSQTVSDGVISIESVTGNIVITATATASSGSSSGSGESSGGYAANDLTLSSDYTGTYESSNVAITGGTASYSDGNTLISPEASSEDDAPEADSYATYASGNLTLDSATVARSGSNATIGDVSFTGSATDENLTLTRERFSVTNTLTNCTTSNTATTADRGDSYSATITADDGYTLSNSVTCYMNGVKQTVTDGVVSIENVAGNIIITATATESGSSSNEIAITKQPVATTDGDTVTVTVQWTGEAAAVAWYPDGNGGSDDTFTEFASNDNGYYCNWSYDKSVNNYSTVYCVIVAEGGTQTKSDTITLPASSSVASTVSIASQPTGTTNDTAYTVTVQWTGEAEEIKWIADETLVETDSDFSQNDSGYYYDRYTYWTDAANFSQLYCIITGTDGSVVTSDAVSLPTGSGTMITHLVTQNLTCCTSSNPATRAADGVTYTTKITPTDGYTLRNITCTMSGTSQTVTGDTVTVDSVSGNLVITAKATLTTVELELTASPDDASVAEGESVEFVCSAKCSETLTFKWYKSTSSTTTLLATVAADETDDALQVSRYTLDSVSASDGGIGIYCVVSDGNGNTVTSSTAYLTVTSATNDITITTQPTSQTVNAGEAAKFTTEVTSTNAPTFTWNKTAGYRTGTVSTSTRDQDDTGSYKSILSLTETEITDDGGSFQCVVSDSQGNSVSTQTVELTVVGDITITAQPTSGSGEYGKTLKLSCYATGTGSLKFQWQERNNSLEYEDYTSEYVAQWDEFGTKGSAISITNTDTSITSRTFRCVVSDDYDNSVESSIATLSWYNAYTVTTSLTNCSTSNSATSAREGKSYSATITADDGYTLDSVTCTMGGTAQTVTDGVISIDSVTGDIVITATATASGSSEDGVTILSFEMSVTQSSNGSAYYFTPTVLYTGDGVVSIKQTIVGGNATTTDATISSATYNGTACNSATYDGGFPALSTSSTLHTARYYDLMDSDGNVLATTITATYNSDGTVTYGSD